MESTKTKKNSKIAANYVEGIGRRKTAVARVRLINNGTKFLINGKKVSEYFSLKKLQEIAQTSLKQLQLTDKFGVEVKISGGGVSAQAEAIRHGLARALVSSDATLKPRLRALGFLTRDSRMVERKKYGLKKARRAPQWAKR